MNEIKENLTDEELNLINKLKLQNTEDLLELEDALSEYLQLHCINEHNDLNNEGLICESILNKIGNL